MQEISKGPIRVEDRVVRAGLSERVRRYARNPPVIGKERRSEDGPPSLILCSCSRGHLTG